jgi:hypothetical protein
MSSAVKKYVCNSCGAAYDTKSGLGGHRSHCQVIPVKKDELTLPPCTCFQESGICEQHEANSW